VLAPIRESARVDIPKPLHLRVYPAGVVIGQNLSEKSPTLE
jgi:hypothetical protein